MPTPRKRSRSTDSAEQRSVLLSEPTDKGIKRRLFFDSSFDSRDLRLVEVPSDMIDIVKSGQNLKIVGDANKGDTVLCSDDRTYSLRKVETSNHIFLVPPCNKHEFSLESQIKDYYEIKPILGKISKIKELLQDHVYTGPDDEENILKLHSKNFLTKLQLINQIQASNAEMNKAMNSLGVVELDGYMRMLGPDAVSAVSRDLLDTAIVSDWDLTQLDENLCAEAMPETARVLLQHVLSTLGQRSSSSSSSSSSSTGKSNDKTNNSTACTTWVLDSDKVARKTAHILFENKFTEMGRHEAWPVPDFLLEWGARTPGLGEVRRELLSGIAILIKDDNIKDINKKEVYKYAPANNIILLNSCQKRLENLFTIKSKYNKDELEPYVADLVGGPGKAKSIDELLLANARLVQGMYMQK